MSGPDLEAAVRRGDLAAATAALRDGADANRRGSDGLTPLMVAAGFGQPQMVAILLTAGADALAIEPCMGAAALRKAAQAGSPDVATLLLDRGAFVDQQSPVLGHTPRDRPFRRHGAARGRLFRPCRGGPGDDAGARPGGAARLPRSTLRAPSTA